MRSHIKVLFDYSAETILAGLLVCFMCELTRYNFTFDINFYMKFKKTRNSFKLLMLWVKEKEKSLMGCGCYCYLYNKTIIIMIKKKRKPIFLLLPPGLVLYIKKLAKINNFTTVQHPGHTIMFFFFPSSFFSR